MWVREAKNLLELFDWVNKNKWILLWIFDEFPIDRLEPTAHITKEERVKFIKEAIVKQRLIIETETSIFRHNIQIIENPHIKSTNFINIHKQRKERNNIILQQINKLKEIKNGTIIIRSKYKLIITFYSKNCKFQILLEIFCIVDGLRYYYRG